VITVHIWLASALRQSSPTGEFRQDSNSKRNSDRAYLQNRGGPEDGSTLSGTAPNMRLIVRSPRFRMDGIYLDAEDQRLFESANTYLRAKGIQLRLVDPDEDYEGD
jgi:hypothetical protein